MRKKHANSKGFTLFELLAVLAILAIVASVAIPRVMQTIKSARIQKLKNEMITVLLATERMVMEMEMISESCLLPSNTEETYISYQAILTIDNAALAASITNYIDVPPYLGIVIGVTAGADTIKVLVEYPGYDGAVTYGGVSLSEMARDNWPTSGGKNVVVEEDRRWTYYNEFNHDWLEPDVIASKMRVSSSNYIPINSNHNHLAYTNDYASGLGR